MRLKKTVRTKRLSETTKTAEGITALKGRHMLAMGNAHRKDW